MIRTLTKLALYSLALVAVMDMARYRRREHDRLKRKEALMTWEDEGGAPVPASPAHPI